MENFKKEKVSLWRRIAALALAAALALGLAACDATAVVPGSSTPTVSTAQPAGDDQTANFEMHFLDVGQALSVLVECDGQGRQVGEGPTGCGLTSPCLAEAFFVAQIRHTRPDVIK